MKVNLFVRENVAEQVFHVASEARRGADGYWVLPYLYTLLQSGCFPSWRRKDSKEGFFRSLKHNTPLVVVARGVFVQVVRAVVNSLQGVVGELKNSVLDEAVEDDHNFLGLFLENNSIHLKIADNNSCGQSTAEVVVE